jgi:hypothetical protein
MNTLRLLWAFSILIAGIDLQAQNTGDAAISNVKETKSNGWQSWTFAAIAFATAAGAVFFVSINNGKRASDTSTNQ